MNEQSKELYELTCREACEEGWLTLTLKQVDALYGEEWIPLRRLPVAQKDKLKPIDDRAQNQLNDAFNSIEKITLRATDQILILMRQWSST